MADPIDLYFWPTPNCWKVSIALEEMGLPYDVKLVNIYGGDQKQAANTAVNPNAKVPSIVDPDGPEGKPITVFESGAILLYLARKTGRFYGTTERERIEIDQWL
ncbi:MAG TPA: glutathione S-transferase N-terminal domain-containing protein, partial [Paracoccaceae bacterium]|nr:glutathione S-transferase N-terminal domain-containing protein [Paracoccaceae bacterium]